MKTSPQKLTLAAGALLISALSCSSSSSAGDPNADLFGGTWSDDGGGRRARCLGSGRPQSMDDMRHLPDIGRHGEPVDRKPATFVAYGNAGGARGVEQLRLVLAELQVASLEYAVHIGYAEFLGMLRQGKAFADYPYLEQAAVKMLDDLVWWTNTLRLGRAAKAAGP